MNLGTWTWIAKNLPIQQPNAQIKDLNIGNIKTIWIMNLEHTRNLSTMNTNVEHLGNMNTITPTHWKFKHELGAH